jgi:hypothetical protein
MPANESIDEPSDSPSNAQNDIMDSSSVIRPGTTTTRFDPAAMVAASDQQLSVIRNELRKEIKPKSFIERMYVDDLGYIIWEIRQLRVIKNSLIRYEMHPALTAILQHVLAESDTLNNSNNQRLAKRLAAGWHGNKKDQAQVERILTQFNLDENNIEAEAWRRLSADLDVLERQLTTLEIRRDKTIKALANFRDGLAQRLKLKVQQIAEADDLFEADTFPETEKPDAYLRLS